MGRNTSQNIIFKHPLLKLSLVIVAILLSFLGGYFINSTSLSKSLETEIKINSNEQRSAYDVQTELLRSFKAENLEKNSRLVIQDYSFSPTKLAFLPSRVLTGTWRLPT